jgi:hypothetical protein
MARFFTHNSMQFYFIHFTWFKVHRKTFKKSGFNIFRPFDVKEFSLSYILFYS